MNGLLAVIYFVSLVGTSLVAIFLSYGAYYELAAKEAMMGSYSAAIQASSEIGPNSALLSSYRKWLNAEYCFYFLDS